MTADNSSSLVRLNVGGKKFCTYIASLTEREPNSMLAVMFREHDNLVRDEKGYVFIDRNGEYFEYILDWLRDGDVPAALEDSKLSQLLKEARYFQLKRLVNGIDAILSKKQTKQSNPDFTRLDVIKYIYFQKSDKKPRFRGVNLSGIDLSNLDLSEIDFSHACLRNTCFSGANLSGSDLRNVDAYGAVFDSADLLCADFNGANIQGASFTNARGSDLGRYR